MASRCPFKCHLPGAEIRSKYGKLREPVVQKSTGEMICCGQHQLGRALQFSFLCLCSHYFYMCCPQHGFGKERGSGWVGGGFYCGANKHRQWEIWHFRSTLNSISFSSFSPFSLLSCHGLWFPLSLILSFNLK